MSSLERDDLLRALQDAPRPEREALLIAARFFPLRPLERGALLLKAPTREKMLALDHYGVELCIGRPLRRTPWEPQRLLQEIRSDLHWLSLENRHMWWFGDEQYPAHLRGTHDPPIVLFGWGESRVLEFPGVALVGTREPDQKGRVAAYNLGLDLSRHGVVVVSGLARGIDAAAHRGAIVPGTPAIAVLGSGVDTVYPRENRALAGDLLEAGGIIVSEYPPGTPAHRMRFPARNRIIVGLSRGVVVVQAPERSGALITADFGLQLGVEVMVHEAGAGWTGCRRLIADGAATVATAMDVLSRVAPGVHPGITSGDGMEPVQQDAEELKLAMFGPEPEISL